MAFPVAGYISRPLVASAFCAGVKVLMSCLSAGKVSFTYTTHSHKTFVLRGKDDVKQFSRMAANTAKTFETTSKEFAK